MSRNDLRKRIFEVTENDFEDLALKIFRYQYSANEVYQSFCKLIRKMPSAVLKLSDIPFLPINFFKTHPIITGLPAEKIFTSSGTTGEQASKHRVADLKLYEESYRRAFSIFFGDPSKYCILALLPSYLERSDSSLIYMVEGLMKQSAHSLNGFFLYNHEQLYQRLVTLEEEKQPTILFGVTFALLDFADKFPMQLQHCSIVETGGMKGRRQEITRDELHVTLGKAFGSRNICSEYGMTELLSQAYSTGEGKFRCPPWMKIFIRDASDPFQGAEENSSGAINIIDLANIDSCSFIATEDLGKLNPDHSFEVQGRMDYSDVRGCNLMWS